MLPDQTTLGSSCDGTDLRTSSAEPLPRGTATFYTFYHEKPIQRKAEFSFAPGFPQTGQDLSWKMGPGEDIGPSPIPLAAPTPNPAKAEVTAMIPVRRQFSSTSHAGPSPDPWARSNVRLNPGVGN